MRRTKNNRRKNRKRENKKNLARARIAQEKEKRTKDNTNYGQKALAGLKQLKRNQDEL